MEGLYFRGADPLPETNVPSADFLTDLEGVASLHLTLPPRPKEHGLYQVALKVIAAPDAGITDAPTLILPLRPKKTSGVKPLTTGARFSANGLARFALIGISSDGKARDVSGLSYQVYEEGRKFRLVSGTRVIGSISRKLSYAPSEAALFQSRQMQAVFWNGLSQPKLPLEIQDINGKLLAQTTFSAGWILRLLRRLFCL